MTLSRQHRAELKRRRGSALSPTAKSEHRAGVFEAARVEGNGIVRCYADPTAETCRGRLQAAHWIAVQTLRIKQRNARIVAGGVGFYHPPESARLTNADLSDLIADPRNGVPLCEMHHQALDHKRLSLAPPQSVIEFATEYGLGHLLEPTTKEAA